MNGYTIFIAQPLLRFCDDFIIIIQTSMFDFKQSKNNIKNSSPHNPPKVEGLSD